LLQGDDSRFKGKFWYASNQPFPRRAFGNLPDGSCHFTLKDFAFSVS